MTAIRPVLTAIVAVAAVAAIGAPGASASKFLPPANITSAQLVETNNCAPNSQVPAYDITATNVGCDVALRVAYEWSEMTRLEKCPRYRCQVREFVCTNGTEVSLGPRVWCSVGSRAVRWLIPNSFEMAS